MRAIAAVVIFFIPSIVGLIMTAVGETTKDGSANGWKDCAEVLGLK